MATAQSECAGIAARAQPLRENMLCGLKALRVAVLDVRLRLGLFAYHQLFAEVARLYCRVPCTSSTVQRISPLISLAIFRACERTSSQLVPTTVAKEFYQPHVGVFFPLRHNSWAGARYRGSRSLGGQNMGRTGWIREHDAVALSCGADERGAVGRAKGNHRHRPATRRRGPEVPWAPVENRTRPQEWRYSKRIAWPFAQISAFANCASVTQ